jgi:hypothetical protein
MECSFLVSTMENLGGQRKIAGSSSEQTNQYSAMGKQILTTEDTGGTESDLKADRVGLWIGFGVD